jgi:hypothetical protein
MNYHIRSYGKSPSLIGKSTISLGHVQYLCEIPEGSSGYIWLYVHLCVERKRCSARVSSARLRRRKSCRATGEGKKDGFHLEQMIV